MLRSLWGAVVDFLFPPRCPICAAYVESVGEWCESCLAKTARPHRLPLTVAMLAVISEAWAVSRYHGGTRDLVRTLKYRGQKGVLPYINTLLSRVAAAENITHILAESDIAVPVPLHQKKEKARGFNQTELIFRDFLAGRNIPLQKILVRTRFTQPMYRLTAAERNANLRGAFALRAGADVQDKTILLLDDILTTGSTLFECAKVLKAAGAKAIYVLVLASDHG